MALQKVIDVLSDSACVCTVFSHTLPQGKEEVCRVFVLEQKINFINEDKGVLTLCTVLSIFLFAATLLTIYLLSMHFTPIMDADPLPGLHPLTLVSLGASGCFASLSIFFMGTLGRKFHKSKKLNRKQDSPSGSMPQADDSEKDGKYNE